MSPQRPTELFRHLLAAERRAASAAAASVAMILVLTLALSAAGSAPPNSDLDARALAAQTHGDLRESALKAMVARMDPATAALARGFDPAAFTPQTPLVGALKDDPALVQLQAAEEAQDAEARVENAAIPFARDVTPAAPFFLHAKSKDEHDRAVRCLTNAIYYEAALEPVEGQRAVAQVVLNRVRDSDFPKSICGVVYEGWEKDTGCQFSFTCDGALVREPIAELWNQDRKVAEAALNGYVMGAVGMATHYHADYVSPAWAPHLVKVSQIGQHIFYRWPGQAGLPGAFTASYAGGEARVSLDAAAAKAAHPPVEVVQAAVIGLPGLPGRTLPGLPGSGLAGLPTGLAGLRAVAVADGQGGTRARVQGSFTTAPPAPAAYVRRAATPEEVARINSLLDQRFPPAAQSPTAKAAEASAGVPAAETLSEAGPVRAADAG